MTCFLRGLRATGLWLVIGLLLLVGCGSGDDEASSSGSLSGELTVFAAASLTDAFAEIATALEDEYPNFSVEFNFGGSQQLVTQLADGAGANVFASANLSQMTAAQDAGVINGEPVVFTRNTLAIVVPNDNPAGINQPVDLANDGIKLVIANPDVPAGRYTLDAFDKMSADPTYGPDFRERVERNIVSHEDNVRQVVAKVQLGEADAGIAYITDVVSDVADSVTIIEIPDAVNVVADYLIAPVTDGNATLAQAFIDFLISPAGQKILERHGFTPLQ